LNFYTTFKKGGTKMRKTLFLVIALFGVFLLNNVTQTYAMEMSAEQKMTTDINVQSSSGTNFNYDTNVLNIEWMRVPAGEFLMGDEDGSDRERPVHAVFLSEYYISKYEVTFDQFDTYCEDTGYTKPSDAGWGRGNRPAINVSWYAAQSFCNWLSTKTGKNVHLPTEAQWEKAARGTDQRCYPWGNTVISCELANIQSCNGKTMPVGSYPSGISPYGVHDMAGNVYEWCQDWFSPVYYSESPYYNPQGPPNQYPEPYYYRVDRGGSCCDPQHHCRSYQRPWSPPPSYGFDNIGFRLVLELEDHLILYVSKDGTCGDKTPCYTSIQAAINAAPVGAVIMVRQGTYPESIILNASKSFTVQGGWNSSFTSQTPNTTFIQAPGQTSIQAPSGSLKFQMIKILP